MRVLRILTTLGAAAGVALYGATAASAAIAPRTVANGVNITTNNGVAGYNSDSSSLPLSYLTFCQTITAADNNMNVGTDGVGGQLGNSNSGQVAGEGVERLATPGTFGAFYGAGFLAGDPGAVTSQSKLDTNPLLGGILPAANVHEFSLSTTLNTGDEVCFTEHAWKYRHGRHHWKVTFTASILSVTGDTASVTVDIGKGVPAFNQAGIGDQRALSGYTSPVVGDAAHELVDATMIRATDSGYFGFNEFGCPWATDQVNSSAATNSNAGAEPNPSAQIDPVNSLTGGCGSSFASVLVWTGNLVS